MPISRRRFLKIALGTAAAGAVATAGVASLSATLPAEKKTGLPLKKAPFIYTANERQIEQKLWFAEKVGQEANLSDFDVPEKGAPASWNGAPAILFRLDGSKLKTPSGMVKNWDGVEFELAPLTGIVSDVAAFWNVCPHLCCPMNVVAPMGTYPADRVPIWGRVAQPILWCICHDYVADPHVIVWDYSQGSVLQNAGNYSYRTTGGVHYRGAMRQGGPAFRALPIIPIEAMDGVIYGLPTEAAAYRYCGVDRDTK